MRNAFVLATLAALAAWPGGGARGEEPVVRLQLRVLDAEGGAPLPAFQAGLVDGSSGRVYARFSGPVYGGAPTPREGDRLFVHARGYGVAACTLTEGQRAVEVTLPRADRSASVRLLAEEPGAGEAAAPFRARVTVEAAGAWPLPSPPELARRGRTPIHDRYEVPVGSGPLPVSWGVGCVVRVSVEAPGRIVWPLHAVLRDGEEAVFRVEEGRVVEVARDPRRLGSLEVLPDLLWRPRVRPERVDAWRWHLNGPAWLEDELRGPAPRVRVAPDIPFHVFARLGDEPLQCRVDLGDARVRLDRPSELATVSRRPLLDGAPAPGGALFAAGRLDRLTICELHALRRRVPGLVHELPPADTGWTPLRLPSHDWLTVFDRELGLAHLAWGAEVPARGSFARGTLRVTPPQGHRARGRVMVFPVWKGTGTVRTAPPNDARLRHAWPETGDLVVRGLVGGTYGLDVDLEYEHEDSGRRSRAPRFATVEVDGDPPRGELRLAPPRR